METISGFGSAQTGDSIYASKYTSQLQLKFNYFGDIVSCQLKTCKGTHQLPHNYPLFPILDTSFSSILFSNLLSDLFSLSILINSPSPLGLLESSRIVGAPQGESNFHIFHLLMEHIGSDGSAYPFLANTSHTFALKVSLPSIQVSGNRKHCCFQFIDCTLISLFILLFLLTRTVQI